MNSYKQSPNILDLLSQLIENLTDIKNNCTRYTPIEKDIILSQLRKSYVDVLRSHADEIMIEEQEEPISGYDTVINEEEIAEEEKIEIPTQELDESEEGLLELMNQEEMTEDEFQNENLSLKEEITHEADTQDVDESESRLEELIVYISKEEEENEVVEDEIPLKENDITPSEEQIPDTPASKEEPSRKMEVSQQEPTVSKVETLFGDEVIEKTPSGKGKTNVRSLNDLLQEQRDEKSVLSKIQQTKIDDLAKAISINDKFLFIKELFRNQAEEFSKTIHTLNRCKTIDEAFEEIERLKQFYFWDSTSVAYLTLCDLIRRKFA